MKYKKGYSKLYNGFLDRLGQADISDGARYIFMFALSYDLFDNSSICRVTYKQIMARTRIKSKATISKKLKELIACNLITSMGDSFYQLNEGLYRGVEENERKSVLEVSKNEPEYQVDCSNIEPEYQDDFLIYKQERKQHAVDLKFRINSRFDQIPNDLFKQWVETYTFDHVQSVLTKMEISYENKPKYYLKNPSGLLFTALKESQNWEKEELKTSNKINYIDYSAQYQAHDEKRRLKIELDEQIIERARNNKTLFHQVKFLLMRDCPDLSENDHVFVCKLDQRLLKEQIKYELEVRK